ncbi:MAG: hypothetical protein AXA67_10680 [Methylothermaceae bacteria B42]|nr:MAG: hypothetical protein AXA67_10680 [Methylothermaceae bacteria B42]HHJ38943.1 hypothetical protein [Methylothermaceae bacterium]
MKTKTIFLASALTAGLLAQQPAQAALTFQFNYIDPGNGIGFFDPSLGAARKNALKQGAAMLGAYFSNYNATLTFDVISEKTNTGALASAGSDTINFNSGFQNTVVQHKILNGTDANGAAVDGKINWDFGQPWDLDDNVSTSAFDFKSTAMHELLHAFGFSSAIGKNGGGFLQGVTVGQDADQYFVYDKFVTDHDGNRMVDDSGVFQTSELPDLTGGTGTNGAFFSGPNAKAANGGNPVNLYSPTTWAEGSSIAHLDDDFFTSQNLLMEQATDTGPSARTLSAIEIGILKDIGYTQVSTTPVPIPAAGWLFGTGMMALFGLRRRKTGVSQA